MNKLFDLRFVIGIFFTIIGLMLVGYSFTSLIRDSASINRWSGVVFMVFGIVMIILSLSKDADDELLEAD